MQQNNPICLTLMKKPLRASAETEMNIEDIQGLRELAFSLGVTLEQERLQSKAKTAFLKRLVTPDDLGNQIPVEVRILAYDLLLNEL